MYALLLAIIANLSLGIQKTCIQLIKNIPFILCIDFTELTKPG